MIIMAEGKPRGRPPKTPSPAQDSSNPEPASELEEPTSESASEPSERQEEPKSNLNSKQMEMENKLEEFYQNIMMKTNLVSVGQITIVTKYRGVNWLVARDKLGRTITQWQLDDVDFEVFVNLIKGLK